MRTTRLARAGLLLVSTALFSTACSAERGEALAVGHSAILGGSQVYYDTDNVVYVAMPNGYCSGALLTNSWVLTAKECVVDASGNVLPASSLKVAHEVNITASTAYVTASKVVAHPNASAALLRLSTPITINGSTRNVNSVLSSGPAASLVNKTVSCYGYGWDSPTGNTSGTVLRSAQFSVIAATDDQIVVQASASGPSIWFGDSGGPCFYTDGTGRRTQIGVAWAVDSTTLPTRNFLVGAPGIRNWVRYYLLQSASDVMGFETLDGWQAGSLTRSLSDQSSEQLHSLALPVKGYVSVDSIALGPVPVSNSVAFDIQLPTQQANPYWYGSVDLSINVPSKGLNNQPIGHRELTGLALGKFQTIRMAVPSNIVQALAAQDYSDLSFSIAVNVPTNQTGDYLLDNLRFDQPDRLTVLPVLFVPSDSSISANDAEAARGLLREHLKITQRRYQILLGTDTFHFQVEEPGIYHGALTTLGYMNATPDPAHVMARELLAWKGENRTTSRHVFVSVLIRPAGQPCGVDGRNCLAGGGRTFNGGFGTGGGIVHMEYQSLLCDPSNGLYRDFPYPFLSTIEHEIGHAFGLVHVSTTDGRTLDCYFLQDAELSPSIMGYNPSHHSACLQESADPGIFEPEEYFLLDRNKLAFPNFFFVPAVHNPTGRDLVRVYNGECEQGPMGNLDP